MSMKQVCVCVCECVTHTSAFMVQWAVSSEIQGLLGRQPCIMGSWFRYCSLYFTKLHTHTHMQHIIVLVNSIFPEEESISGSYGWSTKPCVHVRLKQFRQHPLVPVLCVCLCVCDLLKPVPFQADG